MLNSERRSTLLYLDNLEAWGFTEDHFRGGRNARQPRVHHFGWGKDDSPDTGPVYSGKASFSGHRSHVLRNPDSGLGKNNTIVRNRLAYLDERASDYLDMCDAGSDTKIESALWWPWIREAHELFPFEDTTRSSSAKSEAPPKPAKTSPTERPVVGFDRAANHLLVDEFPFVIPPSKPGLYIAQPISAGPVPITLDSRYTATCTRVSNLHVKFGRAVSLNARYERGYARDFPQNIRFIPLVTLETEDLVRAESAIKARLNQFRLRSPKGRLLEWMANTSPAQVMEIVFATLAREGIPHEVLLETSL